MSKNKCKLQHKWCKFCHKSGCTYECSTPKAFDSMNTCPKRESERTISLKELLSEVSIDDVLSRIFHFWPDEVKNEKGYINVFNILSSMKPVRPKNDDIDLVVSNELWNTDKPESDDNKYWLHVYGKDKNPYSNHTWALDFIPWNVWLYYNISEETIKNTDKIDIVAGSLYEMTFNGFDEETCSAYAKMLTERFEEMKRKE